MTRILVVDDEADIRLLLTLRLAKEGWDVDEASTGEEAIGKVREGDYDALVLDHRMPGMSGMDVARTLRGDRFDRPIVLYSAYVDDAVDDEAWTLDVQVLPKRAIADVVEAMHDAFGERHRWSARHPQE